MTLCNIFERNCSNSPSQIYLLAITRKLKWQFRSSHMCDHWQLNMYFNSVFNLLIFTWKFLKFKLQGWRVINSVVKSILLFSKTRVQFPVPTWRLSTSSSTWMHVQTFMKVKHSYNAILKSSNSRTEDENNHIKCSEDITPVYLCLKVKNGIIALQYCIRLHICKFKFLPKPGGWLSVVLIISSF